MDPMKADKPEVAHINIDQRGIVELVLEDHAAVRQVFNEFQQLAMQGSGAMVLPAQGNAPAGATRTVEVQEVQKQELAREVVRLLSAHSVKEEMVLYPAVRQHLGAQVADLALKEHHELKVLLQQLDKTSPSDSNFDALFTRIAEEATRHMDEEEREVLPLLRSNCGDLELVELGRLFHNAAAVAPSRPHPGAPTHSGPMARLAAMAVKPVDALKDKLSAHGKKDVHASHHVSS
jgi:hemerythrin superfamily protein